MGPNLLCSMTDAPETALRQMPLGSRLAFIALVPVAVACRPIRALRRILRFKPRLVWGPIPLISIKYWSAALRARGYPSLTLVSFVPRINVRGDFDRHTDEFLGPGGLSALARPYAVFAWLLVKADILFSFLDGGFLLETPLEEVEGRLLKLAGIKLVSFPYGSDIAVPGHIGAAEEGLLRDYPEFVERAERTRARVDWFCRWSDVVIRNYQFGYLPRWDVVWPTMLAIDTDEWAGERPPGGDRPSREVVVVHAPNHRHVKATDALIRAVADLEREGLRVRLNLIEGRPNEEVKQAVFAADVLADQFVAGYAMFAIEGLSAGKPVLSALGGMPAEVRMTQALQDCPILDTSVDNLKENLTRLAQDPGLRRKLGEAGRNFSLDYHSLPAVGGSWETILDHLWRGAPLPPALPPERPLQSTRAHMPDRRDPQPQQAGRTQGSG
jgi:glycosyltransferase involved in cell wall biosynthesis